MLDRLRLDLFGICFFLVAVLGIQSSHAQEQVSDSQWKRGYHGFNMICEGIGLESKSVLDWKTVNPKELVIVVFGDMDRLPIGVDFIVGLGASALVATDCPSGKSYRVDSGIRFHPINNYSTNEADSFAGMEDCPVVSDIRQHPLTEGISEIATNRPGLLSSKLNSRLAYLPTTAGDTISKPAIAIVENKNGGRVVGVSDQSIFANQMIIYRDNALFTEQTMRWLKGENRKYFLVISDGMPYQPLDPSDVELNIPSPSREEVVDALKNLPASALLEFGNSVATVVEDEQMMNDFIHEGMEKIPDVQMNRFLIFLLFSVICGTFVFAYVWQKKLLRHTASDVAAERGQLEQKQRKASMARERQWAAHVLLDKLCVELADRRYNDWPGFPMGLQFDEDRESKLVFKAMTKASNLFKSKQSKYWTRSRLRQLEADVKEWRAFFAQCEKARNENVVDAMDIGFDTQEIVDASVSKKT